MKPIISAMEFKNLLHNDDLIILDASYRKNAFEKFQAKHIKNARFVDTDKDLAEIPDNPANGGRHPLPEIADFNKVLKKLGIHADSHIIIYDQENASMAAARLWWMLNATGLQQVQVLDGGLKKAEAENLPLDKEENTVPNDGTYSFIQWKLPLADMQDVRKIIESENSVLIDVRAEDRYLGLTEPIDKIAGHIPTAINIPLTENLNPDGTFKNPEELKHLYEELAHNQEQVTVHCGSGVTACHTALAFAHAGLEIPAVYMGSWSEWSRNDNKMVLKDGKIITKVSEA